jgi:hypothetical protein
VGTIREHIMNDQKWEKCKQMVSLLYEADVNAYVGGERKQAKAILQMMLLFMELEDDLKNDTDLYRKFEKEYGAYIDSINWWINRLIKCICHLEFGKDITVESMDK